MIYILNFIFSQSKGKDQQRRNLLWVIENSVYWGDLDVTIIVSLLYL